MIKRHQNYSESAAPLHGMGGPSLLDATNHESPLQGVGGPSILDATNHESRNVYDINYSTTTANDSLSQMNEQT